MKFLIHIIGYPGAGKYTVAKELTSNSNFTLFDNHTINNVLFCLTDISKTLPSFKDRYINKLYKVAFKYFEKINIQQNLVFTNFLTNQRDDRTYLKMIQRFANRAGFTYIPVILSPDTNTLLSRVINPDRSAKLKLTNPQIAKQIYNLELITVNHKNKIEIDNSKLSPKQTSQKIVEVLNTLCQNK